MVFNDTSTRNGLIQECEFLTGVGDAGISGNTDYLKHFTRLLNSRLYQVVTMILDSQDEWDFDDSNHGDYPVATTALVSAQRDYTFPTSLKILKIKRVDISYDGTNYYRASPLDINETGIGVGPSSASTQETNTDGEFSKTAPYYDSKANSIWIYPRADATDVANSGKIRVEFYRELDEFTTADTTQEPGIDEPWHRMVAVGAALDFAVAKGLSNKNDLGAMYADYENRLRKYYGKKNEDRVYTLKSAYINYE